MRTEPLEFQGHIWEPINPEDYEHTQGWTRHPGGAWYRWSNTLLLMELSSDLTLQHVTHEETYDWSFSRIDNDEAWARYLEECERHEVQP